MEDRVMFGLSVILSLLAWGAVCANYVWPKVRYLPLVDAARPLLMLNLFRFVGASFLNSGVATVILPREFSVPAAYGDLIATALAWVALALLRRPGGVVALWVFNIWGTLDLLAAFYNGVAFPPSAFGATFYIPTVYVPLLFCAHGMLFVLLRKNRSETVM
jgi:hypothetical protein